jgi:hypothetical protein
MAVSKIESTWWHWLNSTDALPNAIRATYFNLRPVAPIVIFPAPGKMGARQTSLQFRSQHICLNKVLQWIVARLFMALDPQPTASHLEMLRFVGRYPFASHNRIEGISQFSGQPNVDSRPVIKCEWEKVRSRVQDWGKYG